MFKSFFFSRRWWPWSLLGSLVILLATAYRVSLDVQINEWFGSFYDLVQQALGKPGSITMEEFWRQLSTFTRVAMLYVTTAVLADFFAKHYIFRWRQAMNEHYMAAWPQLRHIEGAAQRVQEDTMRFARTMEDLGLSFMRSWGLFTLFLPDALRCERAMRKAPNEAGVRPQRGLATLRMALSHRNPKGRPPRPRHSSLRS